MVIVKGITYKIFFIFFQVIFLLVSGLRPVKDPLYLIETISGMYYYIRFKFSLHFTKSGSFSELWNCSEAHVVCSFV